MEGAEVFGEGVQAMTAPPPSPVGIASADVIPLSLVDVSGSR